jgi:hypothetical protein
MRARRGVLVAMAMVAGLAASAFAQTTRPAIAPGNTVLFAQYQCAADQLTRADALIKEIAEPVLNKHAASGRILTWGYTGVYIGDDYNRTIYVWAADPVALIQVRQAYLPELQANPKFTEMSRICGSAKITIHNLITVGPTPK